MNFRAHTPKIPSRAQVPCKGQGTVEYLVIIAVVVVISLVVVGLMANLSSPGAQVSQNAGKLNAATQSISIISALSAPDGNGVITLQSLGEGVTITKITFNDSNQDISAYLTQGDIRSIQLNRLPSCTPGTTKTYTVKIHYLSASGLPKIQILNPVTVNCELTVVATNPINVLPDTGAPTITLSSPTPSYTTTLTQIDFNFVVSDQNTIRDCNFILDGTINGAGMSTPAKDTNITFTRTLTPGAHTWDVNCTDATGNRGASGQARTFYTMAAPVVYLSSPIRDANSTQTGMDFNFWVSDADGLVNSCSFILDGSVTSTITSPTKDTNLTFTKFGLTAGAHTWDVNCTDANSNSRTSSLARNLNISSSLYFAKKVIASNGVGGTGIYVDSYGNIIVAGEITSGSPSIPNFNITFDSANWDTNVNGQISRGYVAKLNSDGNLVWVQKAGNARMTSSGKKLGMDSNGNIYFAGVIDDLNNWFGPIRLDANASASFSRDIFVSKMDSNGNWLWAKRAGAYNKSESLSSIIVDSQGNSYVAGQYNAGTSFGNIPMDTNGTNPELFISKLDKDGNWLWVQRSNGAGTENIQDLTFGPDGNLYLCGLLTTSSAMLGNTRLDLNGSGPNVIFAKMGLDGNWIWAKRVDGNGVGVCNGGIASGSDGNLYVSGEFSQSIWFGSQPRLDSNGSSGYYDAFVAKMTPDGNWIWAVRGGGANYDYSYGMAVDSNNNIFITGEIGAGYSWFGNNMVDGNNDNVLVAKLNKDGNWLWAKSAGSSGSSEIGYSIALDSQGIPYTTGVFNNSAMFDSTQLDSNLTYQGAFIWKTNPAS